MIHDLIEEMESFLNLCSFRAASVSQILGLDHLCSMNAYSVAICNFSLHSSSHLNQINILCVSICDTQGFPNRMVCIVGVQKPSICATWIYFEFEFRANSGQLELQLKFSQHTLASPKTYVVGSAKIKFQPNFQKFSIKLNAPNNCWKIQKLALFGIFEFKFELETLGILNFKIKLQS